MPSGGSRVPSDVTAVADSESERAVVSATRRWIEAVVVGLGLCPFARSELERGTVRFAVSASGDTAALLAELSDEVLRLESDPSIETTLLIHPRVLQDFDAYNQFLDDCDWLLERRGWRGVFQIASFHPDYRFAGTAAGDAENFSNRSPFPMLHVLREESVSRAVDAYPDIDAVPERNIAALRALGRVELEARLAACRSASPWPGQRPPEDPARE